MKSVNGPERKKLLIKFVGLYIFAIVLIAAIFLSFNVAPISSYSSLVKKTDIKGGSGTNNQVLGIDNVLHSRLNNLLPLYLESASLSTNPNQSAVRGELTSKIDSAEKALQETFDSINVVKENIEKTPDKDKVDSTISHFRTLFIAYQTLRNQPAVSTGNSDNSNATIANLQQEVVKRDARIMDLERQFKALGENRNQNVTPDQTKLQQQNQQLVRTNNALRRNIEQLNKRIEALRKFAGSGN